MNWFSQADSPFGTLTFAFYQDKIAYLGFDEIPAGTLPPFCAVAFPSISL